MKTIAILFVGLFLTTTAPKLYDFGSQSLHEGWVVVNDGVMGGRSSGKLNFSEESMLFSGKLSFENNGGFTRIRHIEEQDLSQFSELVLRVKGDGRTYGVMLEPNLAYYQPHYRSNFNAPAGEWSEIVLPLRDFSQRVMGKVNSQTISDEELKGVKSMGIILTNKPAGDFQLEIDRITFR
ncbi:MAG: CIA30 family protein [Salibacteraceae bacterium]